MVFVGHNKDENHEDTVLINEELTNIIDETVEFPEDIINTPIVTLIIITVDVSLSESLSENFTSLAVT